MGGPISVAPRLGIFFTLFVFVVSYIFREEGGFYIVLYLFMSVQLQSRRVNIFPRYISVDLNNVFAAGHVFVCSRCVPRDVSFK